MDPATAAEAFAESQRNRLGGHATTATNPAPLEGGPEVGVVKGILFKAKAHFISTIALLVTASKKVG